MEVFAFFSEASAFDEHFKILDDMFKGGDVLSYRLYDDMVGDDGGGEGGRGGARGEAGGGEGAKTRRRATGTLESRREFRRVGFERLERSAEAKARDARGATGGGARARRIGRRWRRSSRVPGGAAPTRVIRSDVVRDTRFCEGRSGFRPSYATRDFVWEQLTMKMPNGAVVVARAIDRKRRRQRRGAARSRDTCAAAILVSGYYARAESGDRWIDVVLRRSGRPRKACSRCGW